jgi:ankyrin repeat protein
LHVAAENGDAKIVQVLLEQGMDVNIKNAFSRTPLHLAALKGNLDAQLLKK